MKNALAFFVLIIFTLCLAGSAFAAGKCPQPRKIKTAPANILKMDKTADADAENGKTIYTKTAKPMACKNCHGDTGAGDGKLVKGLKPAPTNFTCKTTMDQVSAGQMFWIIKNGSKGTAMAAFGKTLKDEEIWDVIKHIRGTFVK